jgi:hypothetical protein
MSTRLIAIFLTILLTSFICMVALPLGKAASGPVLYVYPSDIENVAMVPGTTFNVSVNVDNIPASPGLAGVEFNLTWDPTVLKGVSMQEILFHEVTAESDWGLIWTLSSSVTNGSVHYAYTWTSISTATADGYCPISGSYTVANITLKVVGTGECPLHFVVSKLGDPSSTPITHNTVDGFFSNVAAPPPPPAPTPALLYVSPASVSNTSLTEGNNFTVGVNIINASGMSGLEFNLGFNASALNANSVVNGSFLPSSVTPITQINNTVGFVEFNVSLTTPLAGNGTVAVIQLQVEADNVSNSPLHLYDVALVNSTDQPLPFTTLDGSFTNAQSPHDVAVVDVTPIGNWTYQSWPINVSVTVTNLGNYIENPTVNLYYNGTAGNGLIGTEPGALAPYGTETLTFTWNTTSVPVSYKGYNVTAAIDISPEVNSNVTNNVLQSPTTVQVRILGDILGEGKVDIYDAIALANYFGLHQGQTGWNPYADLNHDGTVDIFDVIILCDNFGQSSSA